MNRARVNLPGRWGRYLCTLSHAVHTRRSRSWVGAGPGIAPGAGPLSSGLGAEWHVLEVGVRSQQPEAGCGAQVRKGRVSSLIRVFLSSDFHGSGPQTGTGISRWLQTRA